MRSTSVSSPAEPGCGVSGSAGCGSGASGAGGGGVREPGDDHAAGPRRFHEVVGAEPSVDATGIQTVGVKGYDGFVLAVKA